MAQLDPITCFRGAHPEQGSLRVKVTAAQGIFPIPGASVEVYRDFGTVRETFFTGVTDASGIAEDIRLPALPAGWSQSAETAGISGTVYQVSVRHPQHGTVEGRPVTVFPRIETVLAVSLGAA